VRTLEQDGLSYAYVDGTPATAGYEVGDIPQSLYLDAVQNKQFCALWMSPEVRVSYRQQDEDRQENARFRALGIETIETDLVSMVATRAEAGLADGTPAGLRAAIGHYLDNADIVTLRRLQVEWSDYRWQRLIDRDSRQSFLAVYDLQDRLHLVVNLHPRRPEGVVMLRAVGAGETVRRFIDTRSAWLVAGEGS
jgi:hypothetical protein